MILFLQDVERMLAKNINPSDINSFAEPTPGVADHPVVRTLYDHVDEVTSVVFHPTAQVSQSVSYIEMVS